jgi:hypothetical protein
MIDAILDRRQMKPFLIKSLDFMMNPDISERIQAPSFRFQIAGQP